MIFCLISKSSTNSICVAAPGYDMYYLNVMAGPADDLVWLAPDDPAHHWIRATWDDQEIDPRLPMTR